MFFTSILLPKLLQSKLTILLSFILLFFFLIALGRSLQNMIYTPLFDFDEAHRAETAKRMKEYQQYLVPLTGSPYERVESLKIPLKENPILYLYYHIERPGLLYWLMIVSTSIFGEHEIFYRLPSFLLGIGTIIALAVFLLKEKTSCLLAAAISLTGLISSKDLWLSSQYAQLDTGLTFFLLLTILFQLKFLDNKRKIFLILTGLSGALAFLSKGQPSIIIGIFILFLVLSRKLTFKNLLVIILSAFAIILPWYLILGFNFGFYQVFYIFSTYAFTHQGTYNQHLNTPNYWYIRWWLESFKFGWIIFLTLSLSDLINRRLNYKKVCLLVFIGLSFALFSFQPNKIWWYVLPIIPVICLYIYYSISDYLSKNNFWKIFIITFIAAIPLYPTFSNFYTIMQGVILTLLALVISSLKFKFPLKPIFISIPILMSLIFFIINFPNIPTYDKNVKPVAQYFKIYPNPKCLWTLELPSESVLFYSNSGEIHTFNPDSKSSQTYKNCTNYLITPKSLDQEQLLYQVGQIRLYKI